MDALQTFEARLAKVLEAVLVSLFAAFLLLVCTIVVLRFGFNVGINGSDELVRKLFLLTSAIGGAVGIMRHEHIAITFFIDRLPHAIKQAVDVLGFALVAWVNAAMIWYAWDWIALTGQFPWQPFNLPKFIVQSAVPIGCGLAVLFCLIKIVLTLAGRENADVVRRPRD